MLGVKSAEIEELDELPGRYIYYLEQIAMQNLACAIYKAMSYVTIQDIL